MSESHWRYQVLQGGATGITSPDQPCPTLQWCRTMLSHTRRRARRRSKVATALTHVPTRAASGCQGGRALSDEHQCGSPEPRVPVSEIRRLGPFGVCARALTVHAAQMRRDASDTVDEGAVRFSFAAGRVRLSACRSHVPTSATENAVGRRGALAHYPPHPLPERVMSAFGRLAIFDGFYWSRWTSEHWEIPITACILYLIMIVSLKSYMAKREKFGCAGRRHQRLHLGQEHRGPR